MRQNCTTNKSPLLHGGLRISISQFTCLKLVPLGSNFSVPVSSPGSFVVPWGSSLAQHGFQAPSSHCTDADGASCWHQWLCSETAQAAPPAWTAGSITWMHGQEWGWTGDMNHSYLNSTVVSCHEGTLCMRIQLLQRKQKKKYNVSSSVSGYLHWCLKLWVKPASRNMGLGIKLAKAPWKLHLPFECASLRTAILTAFSHLLK